MLSGCLFTYLVRSGYEQFKILLDREPIEKVLKRNDLSPELRHKLELALEIQKFVADDLKLTATDSYKTYVDLKRPYVTYIVTVAEKYKLEPKLYWYPLVGKLPYKGFFNKEDADEEAKNFDPNKYDVMVRGVSAYSTLGWFDDPLLNTMVTGKDHHLVNMIIHESTHATLYFKSQADFNEQLATFVGAIGAEMYYKKKEGEKSPTLAEMKGEDKDDQLFSDFISQEIEDLKKWYETEKDITAEKKETRLAEIQKRFNDELSPKLKTKYYASFGKAKLNNAVLLYYKTYVYNLAEFEKVFAIFNRDFFAFFNFCKSLEKNPNPRQSLTDFLKQHEPASSQAQ